MPTIEELVQRSSSKDSIDCRRLPQSDGLFMRPIQIVYF
jgi:hypothetical protein